jgi:cbb3-type cytochrome oxidase subunit 3
MIENGNVVHYNDCWEFSFTTNRWRKLGQMNSSVFSNSLVNGAVVTDKPLDIIVSFPDIWLVDIIHNQLTHYKNHLTPAIREAYFDQTKQHVLLVKHQKAVLSFQVTNSKKLFRDKLDVTPFYESSKHSEPAVSIYLIVVTLFFLFGGIFLFRFKKKKQKAVYEPEVKKIRLHNNQLYIGERMINNDLTLLEFRILMKFIEHKNEPIDIIALNELFEDETTSLAAQKTARNHTQNLTRKTSILFINHT